jgi:hypothetical protein
MTLEDISFVINLSAKIFESSGSRLDEWKTLFGFADTKGHMKQVLENFRHTKKWLQFIGFGGDALSILLEKVFEYV